MDLVTIGNHQHAADGININHISPIYYPHDLQSSKWNIKFKLIDNWKITISVNKNYIHATDI